MSRKKTEDLDDRREAIMGFINGQVDDFYCADPNNMYSLVQGYVDDMREVGAEPDPKILDFLDQIEVGSEE